MATMVLDIGGTAIKSGLFDGETLSDIQETPTEAGLGGAHVVQRSKDIIASYRERCPFDRIGISTAGQVDPVSGQIIYANENIPGYTGTRLGEIIAQTFHVPTAVENDVNAAAIGESVFGAGKGRREFVCLTYGTGVGGAIFSGGRLTPDAATRQGNSARSSHTPKTAISEATCFPAATRSTHPSPRL